MKRMYRLFLFLRKMRILSERKVRILELMLKDIGITDEELTGIRTGMLILYAKKDMIKEEHSLKMAQLIPRCEMKKIAGVHT